MNRLFIISTFILLINIIQGQTDRKGIIPFDTSSQKYTYAKIIEIPGKNSTDLYEIGKKYLINKFNDNKLLVDDIGVKTVDLGNFQIAVPCRIRAYNYIMNWTVIYNITLQYKDNKTKIEITSIKLSGNSQGTTKESTLEAYETSIENGHGGKKHNMQKYLYDLFTEIDLNIKKNITEYESAIKGINKNKDW